MNLRDKWTGYPGRLAAFSLVEIAIMLIVLIMCGCTNTVKRSSGIAGIFNPPKERRFIHYFSKPPTWRRKDAVVQIIGIGRSEGGIYDGSRFVVYLSGKRVPKGFHFKDDSPIALDSAGQTLNRSGDLGSSWGDSGFQFELGFELPDRSFPALREFGCSFDNSYVTQRRYGPYSMDEFKKPLVFKDYRAAISLTDWQVMDIPYEMISGSFFRLTADGKGTVSLVKKPKDKQHGYLVLRYYGIVKDVMDNIADTKVSVYGSDKIWHETFTTQNDFDFAADSFTEHPLLKGMSVEAGTKVTGQLGRLVGAGRDWQSFALLFIMPDPVPFDFKPLKVKLVRGEKVAASKTIPIEFRNIPIPPDFWTAKLVERR